MIKQYQAISAFTLAEVLVTLAIIGVVASLTIPSIIKIYQKSQHEAGYKKAFSTLEQATRMVMSDNNGTMKGLCSPSHTSCRSPYLDTMKIQIQCDWANNLGTCWHNENQWYSLDGTPRDSSVIGIGFVTNTGMLVQFFGLSTACTASGNSCGRIYFDINGFKAPNVLGKDIHYVRILENRNEAPSDDTHCDSIITGDSAGASCGGEILKGSYDWEN